MNWPKERLRVITEDVGGAFGLKTSAYPDYIAVMVGARVIGPAGALDVDPLGGVPLATARRATPSPRWHWRSTRGASSWRCASAISATWAPISARSAPISRRSISRAVCPACTTSKHIDVGARCVFTNTVPTSPYRGAGRPEANYVLERAGRRSRAHHRHRSGQAAPAQPRPAARQMPYKTAVGTTYDSGEFEAVLDQALALADVRRLQAAQARDPPSAASIAGIGISCMLEHAGGMPLEGADASCSRAARQRMLVLNVQSTGQGHAISISAARGGSSSASRPSKIRHRHGDSINEIPGMASVGIALGDDGGQRHRSRPSTPCWRRARRSPATVLEAAEADIAYRDGSFEVVGTDRRISLFDLAARAREMKERGEIAENLDTKTTARDAADFPERLPHRRGRDRSRDRRGGDPRPTRRSMTAATCSTTCIVEGQMHGALASGLGQALLEHADLRHRGRPAHHRLVHGLCHAARRGHAAAARCAAPGAGDHQSARRQGRGRGRDHRRNRHRR